MNGKIIAITLGLLMLTAFIGWFIMDEVRGAFYQTDAADHILLKNGKPMLLRRFIAWAVFFSAYLFFLWARWPFGPGTLGYYIVVVALCIIAAAVASIATAIATVRHFRTLPWPLTILGIVPLACTVAVFVLGAPAFR
jgi:hypothetical protein